MHWLQMLRTNDRKLAKRLWQVSKQIVQRITNATRPNVGGCVIRGEAVEP
jgi:hypothetical protein